MHRLSALFLSLMLVLSLGFGSVAHAAEGVKGVELPFAMSIGHVDGDGDQVPADSEKGYPHHHGGCHGHEIGVPITPKAIAPYTALRLTLLPSDSDPMAPAHSGPALRPPRA
jgi:hypothetical protein